MNPPQSLVERFQQSREHLRKVAYRMLGSPHEADDAVQEAWLRLSNSDPSAVDNFGGWLTTVVARVCLDMLRSRASRREDPLSAPKPGDERTSDPEPELILADSVGPALLVTLETLGPAERVAFVLHDMFDLSFDDIATIVGRSPEAARQLASRARRRIRGGPAIPEADLPRQRQVVSAFVAAARHGDLTALLAVLDPNVRLRADATAVQTALANQWGGSRELPGEAHGADVVAQTFKGRPMGGQAALVDGLPGTAWVRDGQLLAAYAFTFTHGKISTVELIMDRERLAQLDFELEADA